MSAQWAPSFPFPRSAARRSFNLFPNIRIGGGIAAAVGAQAHPTAGSPPKACGDDSYFTPTLPFERERSAEFIIINLAHPHPVPRQLLQALPSTACSRRGLPCPSFVSYLLHPCSRPLEEEGTRYNLLFLLAFCRFISASTTSFSIQLAFSRPWLIWACQYR